MVYNAHYYDNILKWQWKSNFKEMGFKFADVVRAENEMICLYKYLGIVSGSDRILQKMLKSLSIEDRTSKEYDEILDNYDETWVLETNSQRLSRESKKIPSNLDRNKEAEIRANKIITFKDWNEFIKEFPWQNPLFTYSLK